MKDYATLLALTDDALTQFTEQPLDKFVQLFPADEFQLVDAEFAPPPRWSRKPVKVRRSKTYVSLSFSMNLTGGRWQLFYATSFPHSGVSRPAALYRRSKELSGYSYKPVFFIDTNLSGSITRLSREWCDRQIGNMLTPIRQLGIVVRVT